MRESHHSRRRVSGRSMLTWLTPHAALAEAKRHVHSIHASFARSSRQPCTCGASSAGFCVCHSHG